MNPRAASGRSLRRIVATAVVAAASCAAVALAGCGATGAHAGTSGSAQSGGTVGVTSAAVGNPVPAGFVGLSLEEKALEQFAGANPKALDPVYLHLIDDIAPQQPVLRIGGDSTDWSWWPVAHLSRPPGVKFNLTANWMSVAHALAADLHAKLILGVDLEADSPALAAAEARAMMSRVGRSYIQALELGNEPELYGSFGWYRSPVTHNEVRGRPHSYDLSAFIGDFGRFASSLKGDPLAGPSMGAPEWLQSLGSFVSAERHLNLVTVHAYPLKHCTKSHVVTSSELLADSSSHGLAELVAPWVALARRHHLPLRLDEMNGISCGGTRGVSDTFTSALWVLDTLFEMQRAGVGGINIHGVPNTINELLGPEQVGRGWRMRVHPEFYGMMMFAQAAPAGSKLLRVTSPLPSSVKVWATRATNRVIHVVVINKRLSGAQSVRLRIAFGGGPATEEQLRAPSIHATSGVTLGGQTFGATTSTGWLGGKPAKLTVSPHNGVYSVRVPAASATMLTVLPS